MAAFSKYFAIGGLTAVVVCARHSAFLIADDSQRFQQVCGSVARYADEAAALEEYVATKGVSIAALQTKMHLSWPPSAP